jgi:cytidyltransferase-like protein
MRLLEHIFRRKPKGRTVISWITFDPGHFGHYALCRRAKELAGENGRLVVCVSDDADIFRRKGRHERVPLADRLKAAMDCRWVDAVGVQSPSFTKADAVARWKPDLIAVSEEYRARDWEGARLGVEVAYLPYTDGISSTALCAR